MSADQAAAEAHIAAIEDPRRNAEAKALDTLFRDVTGFAPRLWSGRMVGYGSYDYTYESGHSGTSLATGFAVGARQLTLYIMPGYTPFPEIMERLGKHKKGKACLYLTRLENADDSALRDLIRAGLEDLGARWVISPT
ncbi:MAG: DUF1801 domain-containing protein [Pseudomonadota bacterium]